MISAEEVSRHNTPQDLWIVVEEKVWDITDFAPTHPGGPDIILQYAGRDATQAYNEVHAPNVIRENLASSKHVGDLDASTIPEAWAKPAPEQTKELVDHGEKPPLATLLNTDDFEDVASKTISRKAWAFYSSAATDLVTQDANRRVFQEVFFRPRILRNVRRVDTRTSILGCNVSAPFFVSPAAVARMVHPDGEMELARGAASEGILQCVSSNSSFPVGDIISAVPAPFLFQLYVNKDRRKTETLLHEVKRLGARAIFLTVDAPVPGKREADERVKSSTGPTTAPMTGGSTAQGGADAKGGGMGRMMGSYIDSSMCWHDLAWLRACTDLPLVLKGVQGAADARMALQHGLDGIMLSNHGGRSLDTSPPALCILLELRKCCPEVFESMEVYVDGGIHRGTDIVKCICLGATAVGLGRPFLYALNYGKEGVAHLSQILKDEIETTMRTMGIARLMEARPEMVNTLRLDSLVPGSHGTAKL